jgi:hypothetical protein
LLISLDAPVLSDGRATLGFSSEGQVHRLGLGTASDRVEAGEISCELTLD